MEATLISFTCGFAYGVTSVVVGQPFDTLKTRMQALTHAGGTVSVCRDLLVKEGIRGLYRGSLPMLVGGALFRSTQFGVYEAVLGALRAGRHERTRVCGIDPHVLTAGCLGGFARGMVESPFEFIKVRRQVATPWRWNEIFRGSAATLTRNSFLFSSFVVYMDLLTVAVPGRLGPFLTGALSANLAWLTIWPLDVVKSQVQSGSGWAIRGASRLKFPSLIRPNSGKSALFLLRNAWTSGCMFRGLVPGLARSTIANGTSMMVYKKLEAILRARQHNN